MKKKKQTKKKIVRKTTKNKTKKQKQVKKKRSTTSIKKKMIQQPPQPKKQRKLKITDAKIKKLLDFEHIEELFHLLNILNDQQIQAFIEHYKNSEISAAKDKDLDSIIKGAKNSYILKEEIKKKIASSMIEAYQKIKDEISVLRKKGVDVYMEEIRAMSIPLKARMFTSTSNKDDFYKVKKILKEVQDALTEKERQLQEMERKKAEKERSAQEKKQD